MTISVQTVDPQSLRQKYIEERDKRLHHQGVHQYRLIDDATTSAKKYLSDPYVAPGFTRDPVTATCDVIIIGGGYGGLLCAVRLLERGITDIRIVEKAGDFGGTWYWNRYPGAQCDIESYIYMPLLEETNYIPTEKYAHANELRAHAQRIAHHYNLHPRTLFQTEAQSLTWDESTSRWNIHTNRADRLSARFIIPAAGPLHRPKLPGVPGIDAFTGHSFHSSRWDYAYTGGDCTGGLDQLADKRVAIIGTGATAVQIVPHLAQTAKHLYVVQRTPSSIDERNNRPTDPAWAEGLAPGWQQTRMNNFDTIVSGGHETEDLVADGWTDILRRLFVRPDQKNGSSTNHAEADADADAAAKSEANVPTDPAADAARIAEILQLADYEKMNAIRARVDRLVDDPKTAAALKPWYNQFCKRPCFHDAYLQSFNSPTVTLLDTDGKGLDRITPTGIVANNTEYEVDCIVYATGFELATDWSHRTGFEIHGRGGIPTTEAWKDGRMTLHGWASRGFPNCFFIGVVQAALSPNFLHTTAEQAGHFAYVIDWALRRGVASLEPTELAQQQWVDTCVELGKPTRQFLMECTPGYYNNEGMLDGPDEVRIMREARYAGGSPAFFKVLREWREEGKLRGLEMQYLS